MKNRSAIDRIGYLTLFICAAAIFFHWQPAQAATVTLAWDANMPAPDGYRVYQRIDGQSYDYTLPVWPPDGSQQAETTCTIDGLTEGVTYYFVVRAYLGPDESGDSNEVQFQPAATNLPVGDDSSTVADSGTDGTPEPTPEQDGSGTIAEAPIDDATVADSGTDGTPEPTPEQESNGTIAEAPVDDATVADSGTDGGYDLPNPVQPSYGDGDPPSLAILDNNFAHHGWLSIQWREDVPADTQSRIAMGDIDGDGRDEMVIGLGQVFDALLPGGLFQIVDDDYSLLEWSQIDWPDYNLANGESYPSCGDIDGDGDDEILLGLGDGGQGMVEVLDFRNGGVVHLNWITVDWPAYNDARGQTRPATGDIDNDGKDEIIIGLGGVDSDPQVPGGLFEILDDDATLMAWAQIQWPEYNTLNGESYPVAGDINADGIDDIFVGLGIQSAPAADESQTTVDTSTDDTIIRGHTKNDKKENPSSIKANPKKWK